MFSCSKKPYFFSVSPAYSKHAVDQIISRLVPRERSGFFTISVFVNLSIECLVEEIFLVEENFTQVQCEERILTSKQMIMDLLCPHY